MADMSQSPLPADVPTWTVGDRLGKALRHADISVAEMAEYLGLSRNSVGAYINDRQAPKRQTLLLWAMKTGASLEWLETGEGGPSTPPQPPRGKAQTDALAKLTEQKRRRSQTAPTTGGYSPSRLVAA